MENDKLLAKQLVNLGSIKTNNYFPVYVYHRYAELTGFFYHLFLFINVFGHIIFRVLKTF